MHETDHQKRFAMTTVKDRNYGTRAVKQFKSEEMYQFFDFFSSEHWAVQLVYFSTNPVVTHQ